MIMRGHDLSREHLSHAQWSCVKFVSYICVRRYLSKYVCNFYGNHIRSDRNAALHFFQSSFSLDHGNWFNLGNIMPKKWFLSQKRKQSQANMKWNEGLFHLYRPINQQRSATDDPPNAVAAVEPGPLTVAVHDELIVSEWAAVVVGVRGGVVEVRRVERREGLHGFALGQAASTRRIRVTANGGHCSAVPPFGLTVYVK